MEFLVFPQLRESGKGKTAPKQDEGSDSGLLTLSSVLSEEGST
jgi:hypothetical protein